MGTGARCPICEEPAAPRDAAAFPFCSRRCRLVDLGNWLGEGYRVPEAGHLSISGEDPEWPEPPPK